MDDLSVSDLRRELARAFRKCRPLERKFCRALMANDFLPYRAGKAIGMANSQVTRYMTLQHVRRVLECLDLMAMMELHITGHRIMREWARIAFASPKKLFAPDGALLPVHELDDDTAASIQSVDIDVTTTRVGDTSCVTTRTAKIKQHGKKEALEALSRWKKIATPRIEVTGPNGGPMEQKVEHSLDYSQMTDEQIRAIASIPIRRT